MKIQEKMFFYVTIALACSFIYCGNVNATVIGDCNLTGYTFMGGGIAYTNTSESHAKDYFLAQSLEGDYWGYGWVELNVSSETTVDSAYFVFDLLGVGSMSFADATEENPATLDIYSAGGTDTSSLGDSPALRSTLQGTLYAEESSLTGTLIMASNGTYCVDITNLYNACVTDGVENIGLIFVSEGSKYASFGNEGGGVPYISTEVAGTLVPEPATIALLGLGALVFNRKKRV
jgi:hypothetical protein